MSDRAAHLARATLEAGVLKGTTLATVHVFEPNTETGLLPRRLHLHESCAGRTHLNDICAGAFAGTPHDLAQRTVTLAEVVDLLEDTVACRCVSSQLRTWTDRVLSERDRDVLGWLARTRDLVSCRTAVAALALQRLWLAAAPGHADRPRLEQVRARQHADLAAHAASAAGAVGYRRELARRLAAAHAALVTDLADPEPHSPLHALSRTVSDALAEDAADPALAAAAARLHGDPETLRDADVDRFLAACARRRWWMADTRPAMTSVAGVYGYADAVAAGSPRLLRLPPLALYAANEPALRFLTDDPDVPVKLLAEACVLRPGHQPVTDLLPALAAAG